MKHLIRLAALMTAAAIFALPLGAQSRGHSSGHSSASHSYSGGSQSSGSSRGSAVTSSSSSSRGSSISSRPSDAGKSSSVSSNRHSGSSASRPSSGSLSGQSRPSSGSVSGRSSSSRSSSNSLSGRSSSASRPSSSLSGQQHSSSGSVSSGFSTNHRRSGSVNSADRPSGDYGSSRPRPGSRPYADGGRQAPSSMGHVRMNPHPDHHRVRRHEPRELRGIPAHFSHRGHHHYGHYIYVLPPHYVVRRYRGIDYYFWDDIWYRYYAGRYWVCRPPFGYVFSPLADAALAACTFAYYFDRNYYYDTINENARLIAEQNSTIAANNALIAEQNAAIAENASLAEASGNLARSLGLVQSFADAGAEYFYNDGVFYVKGADGQYTVVVPPAGAQVEALPEDYEVIELDGNTYYKVDDTVYRVTVNADGNACFEVLGQLIS